MESVDFRTDPRFNILNIAHKVNIKILKPVRNSGKFLAVCPFCNDKSGHLYLTLENGNYSNVYKCVKCGESGSAVQLYAKMRGIDTSSAVKELANEDNVNIKLINISKREIASKNNNKINEIRSEEHLSNIYNDMLDMLVLNESHKKNMIERGMFFSRVKKQKYKSIPVDYKERNDICIKLQQKYGKDALNGVSGFFFQRNYGKWDFFAPQGMFIPVRNVDGKIVALQIRRDSMENKRRYLSFSSIKYFKGTPCRPHVHVSHGEIPKWENVLITEGPIKADISSQFLDCTVLALPGVGALHQELIDILKANKVKNVEIAFDMDIIENEAVKKALDYLIEKLKEEDINYKQATWKNFYLKNKKLKGIDDYLSYRYNLYLEEQFSY